MFSRLHSLSGALLCASLAACAAPEGSLDVRPEDRTKAGDGKFDSSVEAIFVDFELDGELLASSSWGAQRAIEDQLLYTVGHLNGDNSVGRIDRLEISDIQSEPTADGKVRITYHARLPVAWGDRDDVPATYDFVLPRDFTFSAQNAFLDRYSHDCVDFGAHDVTLGDLWYYYRPFAYRCELADADVVDITASVSVSTINTTGKYPEYHKVWEDGVLEVVAIFGKYEDGATSSGDAGISAYDTFVSRISRELEPFGLATTPATVPYRPGVEVPEITFEADLGGGKRVRVVAFLIDGVRTAGAEFNARYAELSSRADLIAYNGHSGLGANIRALARKGQWVAGQYQIVFMNGCDTYAYVDSALWDAHSAVNPDDPNGTKYMDIVTNAMPAFFHSTADATMALVSGLLSHDEPLTYEMMFRQIDSYQVVLVSGEADNQFVPGGGGDDGDGDWAGLEESGTVLAGEEVRFETPVLAPGRYVFSLSGTSDADLYVRVGEAPTVSLFDCRPYRYGSNEVCSVDLSADAAIHVMVRGWASSSDWTLVGEKQ